MTQTRLWQGRWWQLWSKSPDSPQRGQDGNLVADAGDRADPHTGPQRRLRAGEEARLSRLARRAC